MYGKAVILIVTFLVLVSFDPGPPDSSRIVSLYHRADSLFQLPQSTPASDSMAIRQFQQVIGELQRSTPFKGRDTLLFQSWLKKGILLDAGADYGQAKTAYSHALSLHPIDDSLTFVLHVYIGTCYHYLNDFDSASYFLLNAESQAGRFKDQDDQVRLYNILGVMFYDNGNYRQGKNYFDHSLEIVKGGKPFDSASAVILQTNIASCSYHLGQYEEALATFNKILTYHKETDPVYLNMGMAYASLDKYHDALNCFRKVNAAKMPRIYNEMGHAQFQLHRPDSAAWFLDHFRADIRLLPKDLDLETNEFYRAELLAGQQQYMGALKSLQKAIVICTGNFNNEDIYSNPSTFTGTFASYRLFDALLKKATVFEQLYRTQPKKEYLMASCEAYRSVLAILQYIEKNYDTDDAKIFLKQHNSDAYQGALSVNLELYRMHAGDSYLENAFMISEKNKASVITANLEEKVFNKMPGTDAGLLQKERNIKYNLARLNVKSEGVQNSREMDSIARERTKYEMELSQLQKKLEHDGNYYRLKYDDASPGIRELQDHLEGPQALISFYATAEALHIFVLTGSSFAYTRIDSLQALQKDVQDWLALLKTTESGRKFRGEAIGARLYQRLIKPIQGLVGDKDEWIIIPDGFLYFLPFESLPAGTGPGTLLATTTISYQFSSRLLVAPVRNNNTAVNVLAFAPFATKGTAELSSLPASRAEIEGLPGPKFIDSLATKERFLQQLNQYPFIHLATHAISSTDNASASFIAFYPSKKSPIENSLYLEEMYGLDMKAIRLVVVSACETGQGELVSKEGVISLARAFAYAGCQSTISSLWKADDQSTSFILRKFYAYLQKGYTKSKALRQAKLDYLGSDAINKSPSFWSHLMLMGNIDPVYKTTPVWMWGLLALGALAIFLMGIFFAVRQTGRKRKKKKSTLLMDGGS